MQKKLLALVTVLCLVFSMIPAVSAAVTDSGTCGENVTWAFDEETGTLTISGTGAMTDYSHTSIEEIPWNAYRGQITDLVVGEGITTIGKAAFYQSSLLAEVTLPSTLVSIGDNAFSLCAITELELPDGLLTLGGFSYNPITEVVIPDSVTTINRHAFFECTELTRVVLPAGLEVCADSAFSRCSSLSQVVMPEMPNFQRFGNSVFNVCALTDISWYNQSTIYYQQFAGNDMTEMTIPDCVTTVSIFAFERCDFLTTVIFPAGIASIGAGAFAECAALETVYFQGDAPEIGLDAFRGAVLTAYYPAGNDTWTEDVMQQYSGTVTWTSYTPEDTEPEPTEPEVTEPEPSEPEVTEPVPSEPEETEPAEPIENPFTDVKESAYYYEPVMWAVAHNVTGGTSATTFSPSASCTRGQIVTFLWAANGRPEPESGNNPFKDVKQSAYYFKAVLWAVENGITSGTSATTFSPNAACTRAQVVTFLWAAKGRPEPETTKNSFSDVKSGAYYYKPVLWAVENGITSGVGGGKFGPNQTCTRGQIVTFLYKTYKDTI